MNAKQQLLTDLRQIISEQLGVQRDSIAEETTWTQLGADSLDRIEMSLAIEQAFKVDIPHPVGEQLNTVGETADHLLTLIEESKPTFDIRIEAATAREQWIQMLRVRTKVFSVECGFPFQPLPGPGQKGVWHFLARDNHNAIGTLSIVDTTGNREVHQRYHLNFGENERVARYAQLAILKPYRKRGIFEMLIETAQSSVIRPNGFAVGWLLYPAAYAPSSTLIRNLGFTAEAPVLNTEFGSCHLLIRREPKLSQVRWTKESLLPRLAASR